MIVPQVLCGGTSQDRDWPEDDLIVVNRAVFLLLDFLSYKVNFFFRALMFVYNNFDATIPAMDLGEEDKNFIALINKELKSYIDNNERMRWVCCGKKWASYLAVHFDSSMSILVVVLCLNWDKRKFSFYSNAAWWTYDSVGKRPQ